jgi:2-dehydropantoate 2-reductase
MSEKPSHESPKAENPRPEASGTKIFRSIAVVGSGSIGLYYGAKLAAAGHDVRFLMRSGYEEARRDGVRIFSPNTGDVHLKDPPVFRTPEEIGPVDLVLIAVKATSNAVLPALLPPLLHSQTALLTLQNGLGGEEFLADHFGAERVMGGLCFVCLTRRTPASVDHKSTGMISIGEFGRPPLPRTHEIVGALEAAGIRSVVAENLASERWRKLSWNIPFNGLAVADGGKTTDQILDDPELHAACRALMEEVITTANALGHPIEKEFVDFQIERTRPMGPYQPSTLVDWLAGNELEIEPIWGEPLRQARQAGLAMPHLENLYARLRELADGSKNVRA